MNDLLYTVLLVGAKNAGKSTFVNMLLNDNYCQTSQAIETCQINSFTESKVFATSKTVLEQISQSNENYSNNPNDAELIVRDYQVPHIEGLIKPKHRKDDMIGFRIYDTPGTTGTYGPKIRKWIIDNLYRFDLVIYLTDINENFKNDNDFEWLLEEILKFHKSFHSKPKVPVKADLDDQEPGIRPEVMFLVNKCDDMILKNSDFVFHDEDEYQYTKSTTRTLFDTICAKVATINKSTGFVQKITPKPISAFEVSLFKPLRYLSLQESTKRVTRLGEPSFEEGTKRVPRLGDNLENIKYKPDLIKACGIKLFGQNGIKTLPLDKLYKKIIEYGENNNNFKVNLEDCGYSAFFNAFNLPFNREMGSNDHNIYDLFHDQIDYALFSLGNKIDINYIMKIMETFELQTKINKLFPLAKLEVVEDKFQTDFVATVKAILEAEAVVEVYESFLSEWVTLKQIMTKEFLIIFTKMFESANNAINDKLNKIKIDILMKDSNTLDSVEWMKKLLTIEHSSDSIRTIIQTHFDTKSNYHVLEPKDLKQFLQLYGKRDEWIENVFLLSYLRFILKEMKSIGKLTLLQMYLVKTDFASTKYYMIYNLVNYYLQELIAGNIQNICSADYSENIIYEKKLIHIVLVPEFWINDL